MTVPRRFTLLLAGWAGFLPACAGAPNESPAADRKAVETTVSRYVEATNKGDADALAKLYDDAVLLPPDHQPIEGRVAIGEFWRQGTDEGLQVTTLRLDVQGSIGYLVGQYTLPETDEEPADSGKTVMCLRRQQDGSWKVTADIWNSSVGDEDDEDDTTPAPSVS